MGINVDNKSLNHVRRSLESCMKIVNQEITNALSLLGEKCVVRIKDRSGEDSWFDQSGNLRSSIGYAVYNEGRKVVESTFQQVLNGAEGTAEGRKMIENLAKVYSQTYALVVVAGMNYADKVEALDNKDVLASTELWAKGEVNNHLKIGKERAIAKIKAIKI